MSSSPTSAAARILDLLSAVGVRHAFGLPGVHNLPFWRDLHPGHPRIIGVRHEQTTVYAADGLARATGGLGVALTTTGPGAANTVAAFGEAWASGSPVLLIASDVPERLRREGEVRGLLHESPDQGALFQPIAKAVFQPKSAEELAVAVPRAIETALAWPRGPVYLGIPSDVLGANAPELREVAAPSRKAPDASEISESARLLATVERTVLWVGGGAVQSGAAQQVDALARRLGAPVVTTYAARGLLGADHPLVVDAPPHEPLVADLIASAELMLAIGTQFDGMTTRNWSMPVPPRLITVNVDAAASGRGYPADVAVIGDAALACDALTLRAAPSDPWADAPHSVRRQVRRSIAHDPRTSDAAALLDAIEAGWPVEGDVVVDMCVAGYWVGGYAAMGRPRGLQYPVGWGTLGYALPASVGAAAAGRPTLVVCGDGGAAMAIGELATLDQERLPVTVLLVDDGGYGMLRFDQQRFGDPERGVALRGPDWVTLAAAYGIEPEKVKGPGEPLRAALERAADGGRPRLLHLEAELTPPRTTSPRWNDPA